MASAADRTYQQLTFRMAKLGDANTREPRWLGLELSAKEVALFCYSRTHACIS